MNQIVITFVSSECPSPLAPNSNTLKVEEAALSFLQVWPLVALHLSKLEYKTKKAMVMINVIVFMFIVFILKEERGIQSERRKNFNRRVFFS